jgi:excisionase family DNA binding protein
MSTEWLTVKEAAAELGVNEQRVRALLKQKRIPASKHGWAWAIRRADVLAFKNQPRPQGRPAGSRKTHANQE